MLLVFVITFLTRGIKVYITRALMDSFGSLGIIKKTRNKDKRLIVMEAFCSPFCDTKTPSISFFTQTK